MPTSSAAQTAHQANLSWLLSLVSVLAGTVPGRFLGAVVAIPLFWLPWVLIVRVLTPAGRDWFHHDKADHVPGDTQARARKSSSVPTAG